MWSSSREPDRTLLDEPDRRLRYVSWGDVTIGDAGPHVARTIALLVPAILAIPGALLTKSNEPDTVETTRGLRDEVGTTCVFDPLEAVDKPPTWWWKPLS